VYVSGRCTAPFAFQVIHLDLEGQRLLVVHRGERDAQLLARQTHLLTYRRNSSKLFLTGQRAPRIGRLASPYSTPIFGRGANVPQKKVGNFDDLAVMSRCIPPFGTTRIGSETRLPRVRAYRVGTIAHPVSGISLAYPPFASVPRMRGAVLFGRSATICC
jgi:hypothetical protein